MTFRHPLRNDWDRLKPQFAIAAGHDGTEGAIARAMLLMVPPFLDFIEAERDRATPPMVKLSAALALSGMIVENGIETAFTDPRQRRAALSSMLSRMEQAVARRLMEKRSSAGGVLMPGLGG